MAWRGLWLGSLLFGTGFVACVTNHEALEKKPAGRPTGGAGGTLASGGAPSHRGGSGEEVANGGGHADDEPPGDSVLTIVNGIVDAPSVALCLGKVDTAGKVTPLGSPLTDAPFEYGQSVVLRDVEGVDFDVDGLAPIVIAGELDRIAGLDCEAAIARARSEEALSDAGTESGQGGAAGDGAGMDAPPSDGNGGSGAEGGRSAESAGSGGASPGPKALRSPLRVRGLPAISAGTLNAGRSMVLVANGCMGGATYSAKDAEGYCGPGYTPREPTVSAVLVSLSRQVSDDHVALQAVHASLASDRVDLRSRPPFPSVDSGVAVTTVSLGQVAPRPASIQNALSDLGIARKYRLSVESPTDVLFYQSWATALSQGGLSALQNGQGYALVFSGPRADLPEVMDLWNAATLTAIAVDPE